MFSVQVGNSKKNSPQISEFYGNLFSLQIGKQQLLLICKPILNLAHYPLLECNISKWWVAFYPLLNYFKVLTV